MAEASNRALSLYPAFGVLVHVDCPPSMPGHTEDRGLNRRLDAYVTDLFHKNRIRVLSKPDFMNLMMNRPEQAPLFAVAITVKDVENSFAIAVRAEVIIGVVPAGQAIDPVQGTIWSGDDYHATRKTTFRDIADYMQRLLDAFIAAYREAHLDPRELVSQGDWAAMAGKPIQALDAYDRALSADPSCWEAMANKALVLRGLGHLNEALALLDRALEIRPDNVVVVMKRESLVRFMAGEEEPSN